MVIEPKTEKSKITKDRILSAAKQTFSEAGVNNVGAKDISKRAGIGYGTFYLYFKDKKDVFYTLLEQVEDELYTATQEGIDLDAEYPEGFSAYRALRQDLKAIFKSFERNYQIIAFSKELAVTDDKFRIKYYKIRSRLISRTKTILEKTNLNKGYDTGIVAAAIAGMIESVVDEWLDHKNPYRVQMNFEQLLANISKIYFKIVA
jgi:AcrR family transcriptional regulator